MATTRRRRDFTLAEASELLAYNPETGVFRWRIETHGAGGKILPGDVAGTPKDGYVQIKLFGAVYRAQHLAWLFMTGEWPDPTSDVEHKDRGRAHNAWLNLRPATRSQNNMNAGLRSNNRSGHAGVSWRADTSKWHARIKVRGRTILLGNFDDIADAIAARRAAEITHFGDFAAKQR